jgi:hypothetical protein
VAARAAGAARRVAEHNGAAVRKQECNISGKHMANFPAPPPAGPRGAPIMEIAYHGSQL